MPIGTSWVETSWGSTTWVDGSWGGGTPPVNPFATPFPMIANKVIDRLADILNLDKAWVRPVANDHYKVTTDEPFFVYVQFFTVGQPRDPALDYTDSGAGRLATPVGRRMRVYVYTRSAEDSVGGDEIALWGTDPTAIYNMDPVTAGHLLREEQVYNALINWMPLTDGGEPLCLSPVHPLDASEFPERPAEDEAGLLRSCLDFELVYVLTINTAEPPDSVA